LALKRTALDGLSMGRLRHAHRNRRLRELRATDPEMPVASPAYLAIETFLEAEDQFVLDNKFSPATSSRNLRGVHPCKPHSK
jgi:hypothetical protein